MKCQRYSTKKAAFGFKIDHKGKSLDATLKEITQFLGEAGSDSWTFERDTITYMRMRGTPHPNKLRIYTNDEDIATLLCLIGD